MKKITFIADFLKIFFTIRITQNFYQEKTKGTVDRWLSTLCLTAAFCLGFIGQANATVYYWNGSGGINATASWKTARDGSGSSPASFVVSGDVFIIQGTGATTNGVGTGTSNQSLTSGNTVTFGAGVKLEVEGGATFQQNSNVTMNGTATFILNNGATFIQNSSNATSMVGGVETWNANSTVKIINSGIFALADITGGTYPNVIYQRASNTSTAAFAAVAGNFELIMTGSTFTTTSNMVIGGNFTMTSGGNVIAAGYTIDVNGNVSNATTINQPASGTLLLSGTSQTLSKSSTGNYTTLQIASGTTVTLGSNVTATSFTNSGTLVCGAYDLTVSGISQCASGPSEINIKGNTTNIVSGATATSTTDYTDFGTTNTGTAVTRTYTIQNTGTGALTIGAITFSGTDSAMFSAGAPGTTTVAAGASTTLTVTFNPTSSGLKTAKISIINNDSDENPYEYALTGTGTAVPEINIQGNSTNIVDGAAVTSTGNSTDFGSTTTGVAVTKTYTIYNTGTAALTIGTITLGDTTNYTVTTPPAASVAAAGSTTFVVTFNPTTTGAKPTTISIVTDDSDENPYNFALTGIGTDPCPTYTLTATTSPSPICAGTASTVTLTGLAANLPLGTYTVTYNLSTPNAATGLTASMTVSTAGTGTFTTSALAAVGATTITVTTLASGSCSNAISANNTVIVTTTASPTITGTTPGSRIGTGTVSLAATTSAGTATWFDVSTGGISIGTGSPFTTPSISATTNYYVETTNAGCTSARTLVVATVTATEPEIDIQGNATSIVDGDNSPIIGDWTNLGSVASGSGITKTFTIYNTGTATLTIGTITISGSNAASFVVTSSPSATVAVGASTTFSLTFTPASTGNKTAAISIITNDSDENPYNFSLGGTGIAATCTPYILTTTASPSPKCAGTASTVTLTGLAADLPVGTYTVTYNLSAPNAATSSTASMTVSTAGTGTFTTSALAAVGATTITVSNLATGSCSNAISANNTVIVTTTASPTITGTTPGSRIGTGIISLAATTSAGTATWFDVSTGGISIGTGSPFTTPSISATTNYYVETTNAGCTSARTLVVATVTSAGANEINVRGNGVTITDGDSSASTADDTDFGAINLGVGATKTYTIENTGASVLNITGITFNGGNPTDFAVTTPPSTTVAPGASTTFVITLTATSTGTRSTTIRIANDDSDESVYDFKIQGKAGTPDINIKGGGSSISDGDTSPKTGDNTDFGSTGVSAGTVVKTFTIENTSSSGGSILTIGAISFSGTNAADFTVTTLPAATTLIGGTNTTFQVTFNPSAVGLRNAIISIASNDADENPYTFTIQGTGTEQEIDVLGNGVSIVDGDAVPSLTDNTDFDSVNATLGTKTITYTIKNDNTGSETLTIGAITKSGTNAADFTIDTTLTSATLAAGATTTFTVTFDPSATGLRTAALSIVNNDSNENPYDFSIQGTGSAPPEINIQGNGNDIIDGALPAAVSTTNRTDFGSHNTGTPTTYTYTIYNAAGGGPLSLGAITMTGTGYSATAPISTTVAAGSSTTFTITFNPTTAGTIAGNFSIITNDIDENPYNFALTGSGVTAPEIDIKGNSISIVSGDSTPNPSDNTDFGSVDFSSGTIVKTFIIYNTGTSALSIGAITRSGVNAADFTITTTPSASVAAGANTTLGITFDPVALGSSSASFSIVNGDADENPYVFAVLGNGTQTFADSDGDGLSDNIDADDDNDGILDVVEELNCTNAGGTKTNYTFLKETFGTGVRGSIAGTDYCYEDGTVGTNTTDCPSLSSKSLDDGEYTVGPSAKISSWSDGSTTPTKWYQGGDHTTGTGRMAMFNARPDAGVFYTATVIGTLPGIPITYSFWALNLDRDDDPTINSRTKPNITVEFRDINDVLLTSVTTGPIPASAAITSSTDWHQYTASLSLPANTFKVSFINNSKTVGSGNDLAIDDIVITQSLCDYDKDEVADLYDLDSDNDGIPDVVECGLASLSDNKGKIAVAWVDANTNGVHDSAEATAALPTLNSDADTLPDYLDLDSDNDTVFDVDESGAGNTNAVTGYNNGDGDINGDGIGDGLDTEAFRPKDTDGSGTLVMIGDGILDLFDYGTGANQYGNLNQAYPIDSDSDGIPDYLDPYNNTTGIYDIQNNQLIYNYKTLVPDGNGALTSIVDADKDGIMDSFDTNTAVKGSPRDLYSNKLLLDFDGRNDYAQSTAILGGLSNSTLMAWVSLNPTFATEGVVVGQNNFHIRITSARTLQAVVNGTTVTYGNALDVSRWYNVAATYDNTNLRLYLNGKLMGTQAVAGPISADASLLTIGRDPNSIVPVGTKYFKGKIDEVRVFNIALTEIQLQRAIYQEIDPLSPKLKGTIANKEIAQDLYTSPTGTSTFSNLLRYYRLDTYKDDIIDDLSTSTIDVGTGAKIYNHKNIYLQQAPLPFVTINDGDLATAVTDASRDIVGTDINDYNTIVEIKHDNTTTTNRTDLGLVVDAGKSLTVNGDSGLTNTWWLSLNGKIDLVGQSQLVQNSTSDLDTTSAGYIERDQQGQSNLYNYNYWSSPVCPINTTANNTNYTVAGIMKDGYNAIPRDITWISGYDGIPGNAGTPVSLARYWLYKFESATDAYANWVQFTENSPLRVGQGYTLKGSGATTNFTFVGKPNNGTITTNVVSASQLLLVGNPYPSALDAYKFIDDNIAIDQTNTDGTLYFWQHSPANNTHILADYLGSYGVLNRAGGVSPVVPSLINGGGNTDKIPNQYIPVGQGFFVYGSTTGGAVQFNNGQRAFVKETDATSNSLFKTKASTKTAKVQNDSDATSNVNTYKKIRLGYNMSNGYHRQVLLSFMEEKATSGIDYGYDGEILDNFPCDMFFLNGETQLVIQGESTFDTNISYPIGVKADTDGKVSFIIDDLENFDPEQPIFIYDNLTDTYHDIREAKFETDLSKLSDPSTINKRFSLRFTDKTLGVAKNDVKENTIEISHIQKGNILIINNQSTDTTIEKVTLYNDIGQSICSWKIEKPEQQEIQIPLKNVSSGVYIVKTKTSKGDINKKIIIK